MNAQTISEEYRAEQQKLHRNPRYGVASLAFAPIVRSLLRLGRCSSLSDYGAGKCNLRRALGLRAGGPIHYHPYDPAFPEYGPPREADLVTCIDVLEHIEPKLLDTVITRYTDYWQIVLGAILMVLVLVFPRGIAGVLDGRR